MPVAATLSLILISLLTGSADALELSPVRNGRIFFSTIDPGLNDPQWEVGSVEPDGSDFTEITDHPGDDLLPAVSKNGDMVAFMSFRDGASRIYVTTPQGTEVRVVPGARVYGGITWAPDGRRIAYTGMDARGVWQLLITNVSSGETRRVTSFRKPVVDRERRWAGALNADWSPNGKRIAFMRPLDMEGSFALTTIRPDGTDMRRLIKDRDAGFPSWSPDGRRLAFVESNALLGHQTCGDEVCAGDIYTMTRQGTDVQRVTNGSLVPYHVTWSPDGKRIAFIGHRSGNDVYTINVDGSDLQAVRVTPYWNEWGVSWQALP